MGEEIALSCGLKPSWDNVVTRLDVINMRSNDVFPPIFFLLKIKFQDTLMIIWVKNKSLKKINLVISCNTAL